MIPFLSRNFFILPCIGATLVFFAGCSATTPAALERARVNVEQAQDNPQITNNAPVALYEAQQSLANAEETWEKTENEKEVEYLAYLTNKKVQIAELTAQRAMAEAEAKRLTAEREKLLLQARQREIQEARQLAEARSRQAQASGLAAERAREEAQAQALQAQQARRNQERLEQELAELKARQTERGLELTLQDVLFEFDRADLKPGALRVLAPLIAYLKENPDRQIALEGHTDSLGSDAYNMELSQRRAEAVRDLLIQSGIRGERIIAQGLGEGYPVASNATQAGRLQNRRVEIIISQGS
ncbi:MAG TPA: OmpA family protein [Candidatus Binatia bacterium]|nr:OmpA family protein [Candidatus Binatia bacterium]